MSIRPDWDWAHHPNTRALRAEADTLRTAHRLASQEAAAEREKSNLLATELVDLQRRNVALEQDLERERRELGRLRAEHDASRKLSCGHPVQAEVEDLCYWCEDVSDERAEVAELRKALVLIADAGAYGGPLRHIDGPWKGMPVTECALCGVSDEESGGNVAGHSADCPAAIALQALAATGPEEDE